MSRLIVVSGLVSFSCGAIQDHTQHTFARQLLEQPIDDCITRHACPHDEQRGVRAIDQKVRVGEHTQRRCVDDDVIEKFARFFEQATKART